MEEKRMANHYYGIAGKVREELALDEVEEEPKEFNDYMSIATMVIAKHIRVCKRIRGYWFQFRVYGILGWCKNSPLIIFYYMSTTRLFAYLRHYNILCVIFLG